MGCFPKYSTREQEIWDLSSVFPNRLTLSDSLLHVCKMGTRGLSTVLNWCEARCVSVCKKYAMLLIMESKKLLKCISNSNYQ